MTLVSFLAARTRAGSLLQQLSAAVVMAAMGGLATPALAAVPEPLALPDLRIEVAGEVIAMARQADGGVVIGGSFDAVGGIARANLARLHPDGRVDEAWRADTDDRVDALAVSPVDGAIFAGGAFSRIDGHTSVGLARLDVHGDADTQWVSPLAGGSVRALLADADGALFVGGTFHVGHDSRRLLRLVADTGALAPEWSAIDEPNASVRALVHVGAWLYVGGDFWKLGTQARDAVARVAIADGRVDEDWNAPVLGGPVRQLFADVDDGAIYVAGGFDRVHGENRRGVAKLDLASGALFDAWNAHADADVNALLPGPAGTLYLGGRFSTIAHTEVFGLARLARDDASLSGAALPAFDRADEEILALASLAGAEPTLLVGGRFTRAGGEPCLSLVRVHAPTGRLVPGLGAGRRGSVLALARQPDGGLVLGGDFLSVDGRPRRNLARLLPSGEIDDDWIADADAEAVQLAGRVLALAVHPGNGDVYAGGEFLQINGTPVAHLARLSARDGALHAGWLATAPLPNRTVRALALDSSIRLHAGGLFDRVGDEARAQVARWSSDGELQPWAPATDMLVNAIALSNDSVFLGGDFRLAKFALSDGTRDAEWNPAVAGTVHALALHGDDLLVGGGFDRIGGQLRSGLARIAQHGVAVVAPDWQPSDTAGASIHALRVDARGALYVGGEFARMGGQPRAGLARLLASSGAAIEGWDPAPQAAVRAFAPGAANTLVVGGDFSTIGTLPRQALAALPISDGVLALLPKTLPDPVLGVRYTHALHAEGGTAPYVYELIGTLPDGLAFNPADGTIDGLPERTGVFDFGIAAIDATVVESGGPFSGSRAYTLTVRAPQAAFAVTATPARIAVGQSSTLGTTGGSGSGTVGFAILTGAVHCAQAGAERVIGLSEGRCTVLAIKAGDAEYDTASASVEIEVTADAIAPLLRDGFEAR